MRSADCHPDPAIRNLLILELVAGAGAGGMAGGQMRDIEGEEAGLSSSEIAAMQAMKTGALIRAAVRMGALLGRANDEALLALTRSGSQRLRRLPDEEKTSSKS